MHTVRMAAFNEGYATASPQQNRFSSIRKDLIAGCSAVNRGKASRNRVCFQVTPLPDLITEPARQLNLDEWNSWSSGTLA